MIICLIINPDSTTIFFQFLDSKENFWLPSMKDILIAIFSTEENIYLAYWLNIDDARFNTVNFAELVHQEEVNIPFLNDVEKIRYIFPNAEGDVFIGLVRDEKHSVIVFTKEQIYLPINKNIYDIVQNGSLRDKKLDIESYLEDIFTDSIDPDIQSLLSEMNNELANYSSFISVYEFESDKLIASTLHKKKDENLLAREVFKELKRLELIKKRNLEIELKKIGPNVQVFYFYLKGLVFVIYCINIQVNTGIIRLKLKTFLKNKGSFIQYFTHTGEKKKTIQFANVNLTSKQNLKSLNFRITFNNYS